MTDYHVHIGQYESVYYYAERVFDALKSAGVHEVWFSSTTSCLYCKESEVARSNPNIIANAPSARQLYETVCDEVHNALCAAREIGITVHPLYWVVPDVHFYAEAGVSVRSAMAEKSADGTALYEGFKIHPRAQKWDLADARTASLAEEIFSYAEAHKKLILIHCGQDDIESPLLFESFVKNHPCSTVQLAHSRPLSETLYMLNTYSNTVCDTAFADDASIRTLQDAGFESRIRHDTDFPINHYKKTQPRLDPTEAELFAFLCGEKNQQESK